MFKTVLLSWPHMRHDECLHSLLRPSQVADLIPALGYQNGPRYFNISRSRWHIARTCPTVLEMPMMETRKEAWPCDMP